MEKKHKDTLVKATLVNPSTRRVSIPDMGVGLYMRVVRSDEVIEFIPQTTMNRTAIGQAPEK